MTGIQGGNRISKGKIKRRRIVATEKFSVDKGVEIISLIIAILEKEVCESA